MSSSVGRIPLTKEDFKYFCSRCLTYQKEFNAGDWELWFYNGSLEDEKCIAMTNLDTESHQATISFGLDYPALLYNNGDTKRQIIDMVARHEMMHLQTACIAVLASRRSATDKQIDDEIERLLRTFEWIYINAKKKGK